MTRSTKCYTGSIQLYHRCCEYELYYKVVSKNYYLRVLHFILDWMLLSFLLHKHDRLKKWPLIWMIMNNSCWYSGHYWLCEPHNNSTIRHKALYDFVSNISFAINFQCNQTRNIKALDLFCKNSHFSKHGLNFHFNCGFVKGRFYKKLMELYIFRMFEMRHSHRSTFFLKISCILFYNTIKNYWQKRHFWLHC